MAWLKTHNILAWRNNSVGVYDEKTRAYRARNGTGHLNGVADILGILPDGTFLAIEVKSPTGTLSPAQKEFIDNVNSLGGMGFVARNLEMVREKLEIYIGRVA